MDHVRWALIFSLVMAASHFGFLSQKANYNEFLEIFLFFVKFKYRISQEESEKIAGEC